MDRIKIESKSLGAMEVALTQEIFTLKKKSMDPLWFLAVPFLDKHTAEDTLKELKMNSSINSLTLA